MQYAVKADKLSYSYISEDSLKLTLNNIDMTVKKGEFVAVLGHNGCGKSTLAKHFNALIPVMHGSLYINGMDAADGNLLWDVRKSCAMVFQNPDNQFVSSIVKEDIAFGLKNYSMEENAGEITAKVLADVGMAGCENRSTHMLSGGQKQRIAIAGVLALEPDIIIFDEATSMLDPEGRSDVLEIMKKLHKSGKTIIMISHYVEEAVDADSVWLIHDGKMLAHGTPREMLTDLELLRSTGLTPPVCVKYYYDMKERGISLKNIPLTLEELCEEICSLNWKI